MEKIAVIMFCVGALDYIAGNHLNLGSAFWEGLSTIPQLLILMTGFMALAPWIGNTAAPVLSPFFTALGCDPSLIAGIVLGCDGGGAVLAERLAIRPEAGLYNGMVLGSYLGCAVTCSIPLALVNTRGNHRKAVVSGLLAAFATMPLSCAVTGTLCGFQIRMILANTWPVLIISLILLALFRIRGEEMIAVFSGLAFMVRAVALTGFTLSMIQEVFGWEILPGITSLDSVFPTICRIGTFLAGILPFLNVIQRIIDRPIESAGRKLGLNQEEIMGLILSLTNSIPVLTTLDNMTSRGIMLNTAFLTIASFALGDHLAFALQFSPEIAMPLVVGKIISGVATLALAILAMPFFLPEAGKQVSSH